MSSTSSRSSSAVSTSKSYLKGPRLGSQPNAAPIVTNITRTEYLRPGVGIAQFHEGRHVWSVTSFTDRPFTDVNRADGVERPTDRIYVHDRRSAVSILQSLG